MATDRCSGFGWVEQAFTEELTRHRGCLRSSAEADGSLYLRGTLPFTADIRTGDTVQGGVAARAGDGEIRVCAYTFRMICSNGTLGAGQADEGGAVDLASWSSGPELETTFRETVDRLCRREVFDGVVDQLRRSALHPVRRPAEYLVALLHSGRRINESIVDDIDALDEWESASMDEMAARLGITRDAYRSGRGGVAGILARYHREGDRTTYGLLNAITEQARDTDDPRGKWTLEELGGAILAGGDDPSPTLSGEADEGWAVC